MPARRRLLRLRSPNGAQLRWQVAVPRLRLPPHLLRPLTDEFRQRAGTVDRGLGTAGPSPDACSLDGGESRSQPLRIWLPLPSQQARRVGLRNGASSRQNCPRRRSPSRGELHARTVTVSVIASRQSHAFAITTPIYADPKGVGEYEFDTRVALRSRAPRWCRAWASCPGLLPWRQPAGRSH